jgi:hypothetical protein
MLLLIGIASVWLISCVMAVALCVMASRGDRALQKVMSQAAAGEEPVEVTWIAALAEPEPARRPAPSHTRV